MISPIILKNKQAANNNSISGDSIYGDIAVTMKLIFASLILSLVVVIATADSIKDKAFEEAEIKAKEKPSEEQPGEDKDHVETKEVFFDRHSHNIRELEVCNPDTMTEIVAADKHKPRIYDGTNVGAPPVSAAPPPNTCRNQAGHRGVSTRQRKIKLSNFPFAPTP